MELIAKRALRYAGRSLVAGDKFEASERDAGLLRVIGFAELCPDEPAPEDPPKRPRKYKTRRMVADGSAE